MTTEEVNATKGALLQEWSDAQVRGACCEEKLRTIFSDLTVLAGCLPEQVGVRGADKPSTFYAFQRDIKYPSFEEISKLLIHYKEACQAIEQAQARLAKMGISLPISD